MVGEHISCRGLRVYRDGICMLCVCSVRDMGISEWITVKR